MAARRTVKSFTSSKEKAVVAPIEFELEGETFEAYGQVPGAVLLEFIAASAGEDSNGTAGAILAYLKSSMNKENHKRFDTLIHDPEKAIELQVLADIVAHLVEERSSRPTE
jgi:hypothetical protein